MKKSKAFLFSFTRITIKLFAHYEKALPANMYLSFEFNG